MHNRTRGIPKMEIKAVKLYENGFMTGKLALGGEGDAINEELPFRRACRTS